MTQPLHNFPPPGARPGLPLPLPLPLPGAPGVPPGFPPPGRIPQPGAVPQPGPVPQPGAVGALQQQPFPPTDPTALAAFAAAMSNAAGGMSMNHVPIQAVG
eukprot:405001_1